MKRPSDNELAATIVLLISIIIAIALFGCGSITISPDVGQPLSPQGELDATHPNVRGEPSLDADARVPVSTLPDASPSETAAEPGADGNVSTLDSGTFPVCPSWFTCREGPANGCQCPVCAEQYECNIQSHCRCRS